MSNKYPKYRSELVALLVFAAISVTAQAQDTGTCVAAASAVNAMSLEQVLDFTKVLSVQVPPAPPGVLDGSLEIHQSFVLDPQSATVKVTTFFVPKGSPMPTRPEAITVANTLQVSTIRIDHILSGSRPALSLLLAGTLINSPPGGFPSSVGTPAVITMGYTIQASTNSNIVNNFALIVAGQVIAWSTTATGNLDLGYPPSGSVAPYCGGS